MVKNSGCAKINENVTTFSHGAHGCKGRLPNLPILEYFEVVRFSNIKYFAARTFPSDAMTQNHIFNGNVIKNTSKFQPLQICTVIR